MSDAPSDDEPPSEESTILGPYRLETLLGRGGMGEVWAARDQRLDRRVAIKHVRAGSLAEDDLERARARFRREAWAAAKISHPSVVPVFDVVEDEAGDWIVMEFVDGPSLRSRVDEHGPLDVDTALRYGRQIAEGLAAAHAEGLVHRDLKTENVMIAPSGHAKILDFGLAKALAQPEGEATLTVSGEVMGTVRSMSPEQARGFEVDARSDLFALGTLLYEITTGVSPFRGRTPLDTLSRVVAHQPEPISSLRPEIPAELSALVDRLLEKAPERRPGSAAEVADALEALRLSRTAALSAVSAVSASPSPSWDGETMVEPGGEGEPAETKPAGDEPAERQSDTYGLGLPRARLGRLGLGLSLVALVVILVVLATRTPSGDPPSDSSSATDARPTERTAFEWRDEGWRLLDDWYREGNVEAAAEAFQRVLAERPDDASALAGLARARLNDYKLNQDPQTLVQGSATARDAIEADPLLAAGHVSLGMALTEEGALDEAVEVLGKAMRLDPGSYEAFLALGEAHRRQGTIEAAEESFLRAIEIAPDDREAHDALGSLYFAEGRLDEAREQFDRSTALAPDSAVGYMNLSAVLWAQGDLRASSRALQRAIEIRPTTGSYSNLGTLLFFQGLYQESADAYEKALETSGGANKSLIWANLGDAYRHLPGATAQAAEAYSAALDLVEESDSADSRSRRAVLYAKLGDCNEALPELLRLSTLAEPGAVVAYRLTLGLELCGAPEEALETLEVALRAGLPTEQVARDPDLARLRSTPEYRRLLLDLDASR